MTQAEFTTMLNAAIQSGDATELTAALQAAQMTQEEFDEMLAVAIAQGIGGGTYISQYSGEEIDTLLGLTGYAAGSQVIANLMTDIQAAQEAAEAAAEAAAGDAQDASDAATAAAGDAQDAQGAAAEAKAWAEAAGQVAVPDGSITAQKLADGAVTTPKLADGAVTTVKLATGSVTDAILASAAVTNPKIADGAVGYSKLGADVKTIISNRGPLPSDVGTPGQRWLDTAHGNVEYTCIAVTAGTPNTYTWLYTGGVNPNLIDNGYFVGGGSQQGGGQFPINQRGETSYSAGAYSIDRWYIRQNMTVLLQSNGLKLALSATGGNPFFSQRIENYSQLLGKTVTISVLIAEVSSGFKGIRFSLDSANSVSTNTTTLGNTDIRASTTPGLYSATFTVPSTISHTGINAALWHGGAGRAVGDYCAISALKVELGSTQTLAHQDENGNWVPNEVPNYGEELAKCQRKLRPLGSTSASYSLLGMAIPIYYGNNPHIDLYVCGIDMDGVPVATVSGKFRYFSPKSTSPYYVETKPIALSSPVVYYTPGNGSLIIDFVSNTALPYNTTGELDSGNVGADGGGVVWLSCEPG